MQTRRMAPKASKKQGKNKAKAAKGATAKTEKADFLDKVDPILVRNIHELTGDRRNLRIFVPLCGKTPDMLWLANQGHSIVGAELSSKYIKEFFRNSKLEYAESWEQTKSKKRANVYTAKGKDIKIFQCDIFDFSSKISGGQFDGIWDQSAMPVINDMGEKRLKEYTSLMQSLLAPNGRHMVEICKHGSNFVTGEKLKSLYGEKCDVRYIGTRRWKYEEDSDDEYVDEEGYGHGHDEHGDHDHEDDEVEMFYHIITFKGNEEAVPTRKRKTEHEKGKPAKQEKTEGKQQPKKKAKKPRK